ncbi:MAG: hypothetical protein WCA98_04535 [Candidatus Acidiferrales bacterium]
MKDSRLAVRLKSELDALSRKAQVRSLLEIRGINLCSNDNLTLPDDS